jgi:hypothetical protein
MVALANDWRLVEQRAYRYLSPARVFERYQQIVGTQTEADSRPVTYQQMLSAIVSHDGGDHDGPHDAMPFATD